MPGIAGVNIHVHRSLTSWPAASSVAARTPQRLGRIVHLHALVWEVGPPAEAAVGHCFTCPRLECHHPGTLVRSRTAAASLVCPGCGARVVEDLSARAVVAHHHALVVRADASPFAARTLLVVITPVAGDPHAFGIAPRKLAPGQWITCIGRIEEADSIRAAPMVVTASLGLVVSAVASAAGGRSVDAPAAAALWATHVLVVTSADDAGVRDVVVGEVCASTAAIVLASTTLKTSISADVSKSGWSRSGALPLCSHRVIALPHADHVRKADACQIGLIMSAARVPLQRAQHGADSLAVPASVWALTTAAASSDSGPGPGSICCDDFVDLAASSSRRVVAPLPSATRRTRLHLASKIVAAHIAPHAHLVFYIPHSSSSKQYMAARFGSQLEPDGRVDFGTRFLWHAQAVARQADLARIVSLSTPASDLLDRYYQSQRARGGLIRVADLDTLARCAKVICALDGGTSFGAGPVNDDASTDVDDDSDDDSRHADSLPLAQPVHAALAVVLMEETLMARHGASAALLLSFSEAFARGIGTSALVTDYAGATLGERALAFAHDLDSFLAREW
ncbi:uncharacterized protein AMSG_11768 [Thecamonas trahens ATCC 50062]|uniref:Uncharacterized protein n=1 Tax=Thecamonas trahens ATCC 50062 TaxID=461836 RepID=A0A0L0D6S5_THETB|nr:hypothetical protein AMSG_11768 [Thecamonas trahens ATCC 50062]KNC47008.1 hypothetical protein AMSG_11768 [Thecamonas trahens ATCC 50062]|eukprot:XP_013760001.1 hypothetical protein AMSG_11768 [Thecamonas trahens ATCC 50062]